MRYRRAGRNYRDTGGKVAAAMAAKGGEPPFLPPYYLGRLGGELANRMIRAGLVYLTEEAIGRTRASFRRAIRGTGGEGERTDPGTKA